MKTILLSLSFLISPLTHAQNAGWLEGWLNDHIHVKWATGYSPVPSTLKVQQLESLVGFKNAFLAVRAIEADVDAQKIMGDVKRISGCSVALEVEVIKSPIDRQQLNYLGFNTHWIIAGKRLHQPFETTQNIEPRSDLRNVSELMTVGPSQYLNLLRNFAEDFLNAGQYCEGFDAVTVQYRAPRPLVPTTDSIPASRNIETDRLKSPVAFLPLTKIDKKAGIAIPTPIITGKVFVDLFTKDRKVNFEVIHNANTLTQEVHEGDENSDRFKKLTGAKLFALAFADLYQINRESLDQTASHSLQPNESFLVKIYFQRFEQDLNAFGIKDGRFSTESYRSPNEADTLLYFQHVQQGVSTDRDKGRDSRCAPLINIDLVLLRDGAEVASTSIVQNEHYIYGPGTGNTLVTAEQIVRAMAKLKP